MILLDAAPQVLPPFGKKLGEKTKKDLEGLGVEVQLGAMVVDVDERGLELQDKDGTRRRIDAVTKVWAAGVQASPLGKMLAEQSGAPLDRAGRIGVNPDLTLPGHPEVFVIGDLARIEQDGQPLPGVAQVAIQSGRHAARMIRSDLARTPRAPFRYFFWGNLATIGRAAAVADFGRVRFGGYFAWLVWVFVHILKLIGFRNRILVMIQWAWAWLTYQRGIRLITGSPEVELERSRTGREA